MPRALPWSRGTVRSTLLQLLTQPRPEPTVAKPLWTTGALGRQHGQGAGVPAPASRARRATFECECRRVSPADRSSPPRDRATRAPATSDATLADEPWRKVSRRGHYQGDSGGFAPVFRDHSGTIPEAPPRTHDPVSCDYQLLSSAGGGTRTPDTRIMLGALPLMLGAVRAAERRPQREHEVSCAESGTRFGTPL